MSGKTCDTVTSLYTSPLSKFLDPISKPKSRKNVHPEQHSNCEQLVERGPEEEEEQVHIANVLQALLLNDIH